MTRDQLEAVAMAIGYKVIQREHGPCPDRVYLIEGNSYWEFSPKHDERDCLRICAAMSIDTEWHADDGFVRCVHWDLRHTERFDKHDNNRLSAWRAAACAVAVRVARGMKE